MFIDPVGLDETLTNLTRRLLASRTSDGHWEGQLASSALSTATAIITLALVQRETARPAVDCGKFPYKKLVSDGLDWLARNQNADGGWGDTVLSLSNISTTSLCWAAFSLVGDGCEAHARAIAATESWVSREAGGMGPHFLVDAITRRYGKDRTFSAPILMVLALTGRLRSSPDSQNEAWRWVPQLPFELAACPRRWFKWLRLPVVSYALPALIGIGQVRHHHRPSRNPLARFLRNLTLGRTLAILGKIQPSSGGFLEAVPLTSFVVMSLIASNRIDDPVVCRGVEFLVHSVRPDGSWPIDTNLATWVTTLSVNALMISQSVGDLLSSEERQHIRHWLLEQQYRQEHPYTHTSPGGWAWTDRPGGVPDSDDTAGALLALRKLDLMDDRVRQAARAGVRWLLDLQNRDGGMPTFCRGWGKLIFDRSSPDLTAHALLAWLTWRDELPSDLVGRVYQSIQRAVRYLAKVQRDDGAWIPLWFGNQSDPADENPTYGTARVIVALSELVPLRLPMVSAMTNRGVQWLLSAQNLDGGWGGAKNVASSVEETALAINALAAYARGGTDDLQPFQVFQQPDPEAIESAISRGEAWLVEQTDMGRSTPSSPIGLYFARLWYFEKLYPLIFAVAGLARVRNLLDIAARRPACRT